MVLVNLTHFAERSIIGQVGYVERVIFLRDLWPQ